MHAPLPTPRSGRTVLIESWGWTQQGNIRDENQDSFLNWPEGRVWAVADGLGSSEFGGAASRSLIWTLMQLKPAGSLEELLAAAKERLNVINDVLHHQEAAAGSAASTLVALLVHESEAACLWSGDSRCYLLRNGVLYQCTRDHTLRQQKIDSGELTAPEAYRMVRGNIITSALGVRNELMLEEVRFSLRQGDRFLLCSDGLTNVLEAASLVRHLEKGSPNECAESIREAIEGLPQPDNITFVAVFFSPVA